MFGAKLFGTYAENPQGLSYALGKNSEVFTKGDFLIKASGVLKVGAGNGGALEGICDLTVTMASNNQTVAKVFVPYYSSRNDFVFEADFDDATTNTVANQEKFYTITGATGAQQIDHTSGSTTSGQVCFIQSDPRATADTSRGLFRFAKAQSESWTPA
jgi:hypothetical protein